MKSEWVRACRAEHIKLGGDVAEVVLPRGRNQRVRIAVDDQEVRMWSVVGRPTSEEEGMTTDEIAWLANRGARLATFQTDTRGRIVGHAVLPRIGLEPSEFAFRLKLLAEECDRLEHHLTGRDVE